MRVPSAFLGIFLLFSSAPSHADRVEVSAAWSSTTADAIHQFVYDSESGGLFRKVGEGEAEKLVPVESFGKIPGLPSDDIEILASDFVRGAKAGDNPLVVIRHGVWVSIIDPVSDSALVTNIGPVYETMASPSFNRIIRATDGSLLVTFGGDAAPKSPGAASAGVSPHLFIVNTVNRTVGWMPLRTDVYPQRVSAALVVPNVIRVKATFLQPLVIESKDKEAAVKAGAIVPKDAEVIIDLKQGEIAENVGPAVTTEEDLKKPRKLKLAGMYYAESSPEFLDSPGVAAGMLSATGSPLNDVARTAALSKANEDVAALRGIGAAVREGLAKLHGQPEAVDAYVKFSQSQLLGAERHLVLVLGGPTGVGKTSSFPLFIRAVLAARGIEPKDAVFEKSLADVKDPQLLQSELRGATPPYVGANAPSGLVAWLLKNPEAGGIIFDEIDKAPIPVVESLMSFLETGELRCTPHLTESLVEYYKNIPVDHWPRALREATQDGGNPKAEMVLRLGPGHIIALGTNAGGENYGMNGSGREVVSPQAIATANRRFTGDTIRAELKARGVKAEVLNRISAFIPFKMLMPDTHASIVADYIAELERRFADRLLRVRLTRESRSFLETETFDPSSGARNLKRHIDAWIAQNLNDAVIEKGVFVPGDEIVIDIEKGNGTTVASLMRLRKGAEPAVLSEYTVGKPLPPNPRELLARAREHLLPTLKRRILGHANELKLIERAVITALAQAAADPTRMGLPVVVYMDSTPGVGKTEIAKAVDEALFGDPTGLSGKKSSQLIRVDFSDIVTLEQLYAAGIKTMADAIKTSPESAVFLWDELPRAGGGTAYAQLIQNALMAVIDEGRLPAFKEGGEKTPLPPASVIIATGNLAAQSLGAGAHRMTNRELHAHFRYLMRHPDGFLRVYAGAFNEAFRSRLGQPLLVAPLSAKEVAALRDQFFAENTKILRDSGVKPVLSPSAKRFFLEEFVPMEGGRWIRRTLKLYVENALVSMVVGQEEKYRGAAMEVAWDKESRELRVEVKRDGRVVETEILANVPRTKSDYHPEARARAARKTNVHEAGHALMEAIFFGPDAVAEINTFGGGEGGLMEPNPAKSPNRDMYLTTRGGIKMLAILLAGHLAEKRHMGDTADGARGDYERIREYAQEMLLNGSLREVAPIALFKNPSTGAVDPSEAKKVEIERKLDFVMEYAGALAERGLSLNEALHLEIADKLEKSGSMHMEGKAFAAIVRGRIRELRPKDYERARKAAVRAVKRKSQSCEQLLTVSEAPTGFLRGIFEKLRFWR